MNHPIMSHRTDISLQPSTGRLHWAACGLLVAATALPWPGAQAADTSAAAASALKVLSTPLNGAYSSSAQSGHEPPANASAGQLITVQKGESIDAVLRRGLPGMPLKDEFMRQALAKANPKIFPKGQTYPVRPGTVLALPSVEALRQHILAQSPQAAALFQVSATKENAEETNPGPDKRRWIRFP
jgi:Tfp pilus assembly protein FimV